jgi:hypothetical protein
MFFARCRSFLARHRSVYWLVVGTVAALLAITSIVEQRAIDRARRSWGTSVAVWVTTAALSPGDPAGAERRVLPTAAVPEGALDHDPTGGVVLRPLKAHEVVTVGDVGDSTSSLALATSRIVTIPADDSTLRAAVGDHVDVVAQGSFVALDGVVIATSAQSISIAVDQAAAAATASAVHDGTAVLVGRP